MNRQIGQLMVSAEAVGHGAFRVFAHRTAAHHMSAAQPCAVQLQAKAVDQRARFGEGFYIARIGVHRHHRPGTAGKLDLGHCMECPAQTVPGIRRHLVIEHRRVVAAQFDVAALAVRMKAVAQQRQHGVGVRQVGHVLRVFLAEATEQCRCQRRMQRWHFQFVSHRAGGAVLPLEMVGIN
ncbi:hypothetical protein D3C84_798760 [compost metagenome]